MSRESDRLSLFYLVASFLKTKGQQETIINRVGIDSKKNKK